MALDPSIILRAQGPQFDSPMDVASKAMTMRQLAQTNQIRSDEMAKQKSLKDLYASNTVTNADGTTTLNRSGYLSGLAKAGYGQEAIEAENKFQGMDFEKVKNQTAIAKQLAWSIRDEATYQAARQKGIELGLPNANSLPEQYPGDGFIQKMQIGTLNAEEQVAQMWKKKEYEQKERELGIKSRLAQAKTSGAAPRLTVGQKAADQEFGKEYNEWTGRGKPALEKNLGLLNQTVVTLGKYKDAGPTETVSGRLVGRLPDWARSEESIRVREDIHAAVQSSLKAALGSAFTEKEGERIMNAAYNERLSPAENIRKIKTAINEIRAIAANNEAKSRYYEAFGTLAGYKPGNGVRTENVAGSNTRRQALGSGGGFGIDTAHAGAAGDFDSMSDDELYEQWLTLQNGGDR